MSPSKKQQQQPHERDNSAPKIKQRQSRDLTPQSKLSSSLNFLETANSKKLDKLKELTPNKMLVEKNRKVINQHYNKFLIVDIFSWMSYSRLKGS